MVRLRKQTTSGCAWYLSIDSCQRETNRRHETSRTCEETENTRLVEKREKLRLGNGPTIGAIGFLEERL